MSFLISTALAALIAIASLVAPARCARVLAIEAVPFRSSWNFMNGVLGALTANGHAVTAFTPFTEGDRANYTEVDISDENPTTVAVDLRHWMSKSNDRWNVLSTQMDMDTRQCENVRGNARLHALFSAGLEVRFDAVLIEHSALHCLSRALVRSGLPLIVTMATSTYYVRDRVTVGHYSNPATVTPMITDRAVLRTFAQRFRNAVAKFCDGAILAFLDLRLGATDPELFATHAPVAPALVFINSHHFSDPCSPIPTNVVPIGGIHLKPARRIPADVLKFMEESRGVILFTFGSTTAMSSVPEEIQNVFKEALAQLPLNVLIKYEGEMENKPDNVMTSKWFPQRDILMHPNVKLFISHGGISGTYEAIDAGVPVLGFSLFFDQHRNIDNLVELGMAIRMDLFSLTKEELLNNIFKLLNDETYTENAKTASKIFQDRPMSPEKLVNYWTEYVVRHEGAPHLKSQGVNLMWFEYFVLDVIAVILVFICTVMFLVCKILKFTRNIFYALKYLRNFTETKIVFQTITNVFSYSIKISFPKK